eukprot:Blabericola_migrator_1__2574@NODE_1728_length_3911_cov_14_265349_g1115_i0_p1_GENE_NODE_1728_length_3911_cov_14_265349_g1115_i0NODE_1728_length_3911_cov_14_265349_g1115_i0_p1_ORF_typecomplete_len997_score159_22DUF1424/PF07232_11/0_25_NODE_1728_length_3911_cov_14_265349_g1115_i01093099
MKVALDFGPLYPRGADYGFERIKDVFQAQVPPHNAETVIPESSRHQQVPSQIEISWQQEMTHSNLDVAADTELPSLNTNFWAHSSCLPRRCAFQDAATSKQGWQPARSPLPVSDATREASFEDLKIGYDDARHEAWELLEETVADLVTVIEEAILNECRGQRKLINVKGQLHRLIASLSRLGNGPPPLGTRELAILSSMRFSLMAARAGVKSSPKIYMTKRYMAKLNEAIFIVSSLRHLNQLADLEGTETLQPQELESLKRAIYSSKALSPLRFIVSTAYAALVTTNSDDRAQEILDDFLTFFDLASKSIDLTTAQLYLLILLHLRHDHVKLLKPQAQEPLGKLIVRLRDELFIAERSEIPIFELPELQQFYLAFFGEGTWPRFDWRQSLFLNPILARDGHRPIITRLIQYGSAFREGLDQLAGFVIRAQALPNEGGTYATQVKSLKAFQSHLLRIHPPDCVFADAQTLIYLKQFAAFANACIDECQVHGDATGCEHVQILKVALNCLQWCRLLSSYLGVTSPSLLEEAYDMTAKALILKLLWNSRPTACMFNSERAFISRGVLAALKSNKLDDELLACTKMFLDQSVPSKFVATTLDKLLIDRSEYKSDHDKMVTLLALECRIQLFKSKIESSSNITRMPASMMERFTEALVQARMLAKGVQILPAPVLTLNASLQERFVASNAHETAHHLSVDVVLAEALKRTDPDRMTVGDVAYYVATYLLGNRTDERWLDFLTCQVKWCSSTPQHLAEHPDELMTLVQSLHTLFKASWSDFRRLEPFNSNAQATPILIRHFVHMAILKWLSGTLLGTNLCSANARQFLDNMVGEHVFGWMPKWLILMNGRRALFPSDVLVPSSLFEGLCFDVARQRNSNDSIPIRSYISLDHDDVSAYLRRLLRAVGSGTLTFQDLEVLLKQHVCPVLSRPNRNMFLTFLLWAWHHKCLPVDIAVIEGCIKDVFYEGAHPANKGLLFVNTMQGCIQKLLASGLCMSVHATSL